MLIVVGYARVPSRRRFLRRLVLVIAAILSVYLPAYWNKTGGLGQPARAIHSFVAPDVRDASSDLYRQQENANLAFNIREGGVLGRGFGVPIDYALPITDISDIDPFIAYIPHNGVLYVLMRMGVLGGDRVLVADRRRADHRLPAAARPRSGARRARRGRHVRRSSPTRCRATTTRASSSSGSRS